MSEALEGQIKEALAGLARRLRDCLKADEKIRRQTEEMHAAQRRRMRDYRKVADKSAGDVPDFVQEEYMEELQDLAALDNLRGGWPA